ncbi:MAG TPA: alpha/beta fold hydrolase [Blastocatellia bacterium]
MTGEPRDKQPARAAREFRIPGPLEGLELSLSHFEPRQRRSQQRAVLFVHGMSFPCALAFFYQIDGFSWSDQLCNGGFDVWGLDFYGFGNSDRYVEMSRPASINPPLGKAGCLSRQIEAAARFICRRQRVSTISIIAHSAGTIAAGLFAIRHQELVDRMVFFAPICRRDSIAPPRRPLDAWRLVSLQAQWERFIEDVPEGQKQVLSAEVFGDWGDRYLATDPNSYARSPASVKVPNGLSDEIDSAWSRRLAYDPAEVRVPVAIIRGEWDSLCTDADAKWLFDSLFKSPVTRDVKISRATHLAHLEENRCALYLESQTFLEGGCSIMSKPSPSERPVSTDLPGYDYGNPAISRSPVSLEELREIESTVGWGPQDADVLRRHLDIFAANAEQMVDAWRAVIGQQPHLAKWFFGPDGKPDDDYKAMVKKRFVKWVVDACVRPHDRGWLDYQEEIGLRHTPAKKNLTDHANTPTVVPLRFLFAFETVIVTSSRPFFVQAGVQGEELERLERAWLKSVHLHVTLWSRPYAKEGLW